MKIFLNIIVIFLAISSYPSNVKSLDCNALLNEIMGRANGNYGSSASAMGAMAEVSRIYNENCTGNRGARRPTQTRCRSGYVVYGNGCIRRGHKLCPNGRNTCPVAEQCADDGSCIPFGYKSCPGSKHICAETKQCTRNGCIPLGASSCPSGDGYCSAPNICDVSLTGKRQCYSKSAHKKLIVAKRKKALKKMREMREKETKKAAVDFKRKHGVDFKTWVAQKRRSAAKTKPSDKTCYLNGRKVPCDGSALKKYSKAKKRCTVSGYSFGCEKKYKSVKTTPQKKQPTNWDEFGAFSGRDKNGNVIKTTPTIDPIEAAGKRYIKKIAIENKKKKGNIIKRTYKKLKRKLSGAKVQEDIENRLNDAFGDSYK